jgi:hypothetical protein
VRKIISTYLALLPCELRFTYNEYGKLAVSDDQNDRALNFNLSHSADLALHIDCRKPSCHSPTIGFQNARNLDGLALIKLYGNVTPALVGRRLSAEKAREVIERNRRISFQKEKAWCRFQGGVGIGHAFEPSSRSSATTRKTRRAERPVRYATDILDEPFAFFQPMPDDARVWVRRRMRGEASHEAGANSAFAKCLPVHRVPSRDDLDLRFIATRIGSRNNALLSQTAH